MTAKQGTSNGRDLLEPSRAAFPRSPLGRPRLETMALGTFAMLVALLVFECTFAHAARKRVKRPRKANEAISHFDLIKADQARRLAEAPYVIDVFDVALALSPQGVLSVEERIAVTFNQPRHGIIRNLPRKLPTAKALVSYRKVAVADMQGKPWKKRVAEDSSQVAIRIGSPNHLLRGQHIFIVHYEVDKIAGGSGASKDLHWFVTGHQWNAPIRSVKVRIGLPEPPVSKGALPATHFKVFVGKRGEEVPIASGPTSSRNSFESSHNEILWPGEGLSASISFPTALLARPQIWQEFSFKGWRWALGTVIAAFAVLALDGVSKLVLMRNAVKASRKSDSLPPDLTPLELSVLREGKLTNRALQAGATYLLNRGYLRMDGDRFKRGQYSKRNEKEARDEVGQDLPALPPADDWLRRHLMGRKLGDAPLDARELHKVVYKRLLELCAIDQEAPASPVASHRIGWVLSLGSAAAWVLADRYVLSFAEFVVLVAITRLRVTKQTLLWLWLPALLIVAFVRVMTHPTLPGWDLRLLATMTDPALAFCMIWVVGYPIKRLAAIRPLSKWLTPLGWQMLARYRDLAKQPSAALHGFRVALGRTKVPPKASAETRFDTDNDSWWWNDLSHSSSVTGHFPFYTFGFFSTMLNEPERNNETSGNSDSSSYNNSWSSDSSSYSDSSSSSSSDSSSDSSGGGSDW